MREKNRPEVREIRSKLESRVALWEQATRALAAQRERFTVDAVAFEAGYQDRRSFYDDRKLYRQAYNGADLKGRLLGVYELSLRAPNGEIFTYTSEIMDGTVLCFPAQQNEAGAWLQGSSPVRLDTVEPPPKRRRRQGI